MNISECPHCSHSLNMTEDQKTKLKAMLDKLEPGRNLKFKCRHCMESIVLRRDAPKGSNGEVTGEEVEPPDEKIVEKGGSGYVHDPPPPPDISWVTSVEEREQDLSRDIPAAMVLVSDSEMKQSIDGVLKDLGYQRQYPPSTREAIENMRFSDYGMVIYHLGFENGGMKGSVFHEHMKQMSMARRRTVFYVMIGSAFHTLYHLEALAHSCNMTVNESEMGHLKILIQKGLMEYEELFRPYLDMLEKYGKL